MNERGQYEYTNTQYNRCVRYKGGDNDKILTLNRPFLKEYFMDHLELLLMSIETSANKLYVNWVDILPITMNRYSHTKLYADTILKIVGKIEENITGNQKRYEIHPFRVWNWLKII